jgi:hypothetical protein
VTVKPGAKAITWLEEKHSVFMLKRTDAYDKRRAAGEGSFLRPLSVFAVSC